jgi:hypothetical protein
MYLRCILNLLFSFFLFSNSSLETRFAKTVSNERVIGDIFSQSAFFNPISDLGHWRRILTTRVWDASESHWSNVPHISDINLEMKIIFICNELWAVSPKRVSYIVNIILYIFSAIPIEAHDVCLSFEKKTHLSHVHTDTLKSINFQAQLLCQLYVLIYNTYKNLQ